MQEPEKTILYIEDDDASQRLVERALTADGYRVRIAARGIEGIDLAREMLPDLILTDINLPDISGYEIATSLRTDERFEHTPIVALTARGYGSHQAIAAVAGITGYMTKPINVVELRERLEYYMNGGRDEIIDKTTLSGAQAQYMREVVTRLESRVRQLEAANQSLVKLDRMKESFIQLTAHELRTPLTLIYGYSRLLEDYPPLRQMLERDPNLVNLVEGLGESISRMHLIIDEIVTASRIMTDQIQLSISAVDLGAITAKVITKYQMVLGERMIHLHFDPSGWPSNLRGDSELLRLAISNLLGNAIKYTPDGGHIYLSAEQHGDTVHLSIRDTGIGIDPSEHQAIFERFHTINDVSLHSTSKTAFGGGGIGLGLPVCKWVIESHGGKIMVESAGRNRETNPGSTFTVQLPVVAHPARVKGISSSVKA